MKTFLRKSLPKENYVGERRHNNEGKKPIYINYNYNNNTINNK